MVEGGQGYCATHVSGYGAFTLTNVPSGRDAGWLISEKRTYGWQSFWFGWDGPERSWLGG